MEPCHQMSLVVEALEAKQDQSRSGSRFEKKALNLRRRCKRPFMIMAMMPQAPLARLP